MRVNELIDILRDQPADSEIELAVVAPLDDDSDDITVDRYMIDGVLPWIDSGTPDEEASDEPSGNDETVTIWLVGGDERDVDAFLDAIEQNVDIEHQHDHDT